MMLSSSGGNQVEKPSLGSSGFFIKRSKSSSDLVSQDSVATLPKYNMNIPLMSIAYTPQIKGTRIEFLAGY